MLRVLFTVVFMLAGLWMLNHAVFSFWVSGGPPNDYPEAWYHQGIRSFWSAVALITAGVYCQFTFIKIRKSWVAKLVMFFVFLGFMYPFVRELILIDSCLDGGGIWLEQYFRCQNV